MNISLVVSAIRFGKGVVESIKMREIKVVADKTKAIVSFEPTKFTPTIADLSSEIIALMSGGHCGFGALERLNDGIVELRFDRKLNKAADRKHAVRRIREVIFAARRG